MTTFLWWLGVAVLVVIVVAGLGVYWVADQMGVNDE